MKLLCAAIIAICTTSAAYAEGRMPDRLHFPLASHHINVTPPASVGRWEEFNPGLILTWQDRFASLNYSAGAFRNSYGELSAMVSVGKFWHSGDFAYGTFLTLADYGDNARFLSSEIGDTNIIAIPGVQVNYRNLFVQFMPSTQSSSGFGGVVATGLSIPLN